MPGTDTAAAVLFPAFQSGSMSGVQSVVFAVRPLGKDYHWYANFSHFAESEQRLAYGNGGRLCRLDFSSNRVTHLVDDPAGGVRDPQVHYNGRTILFSYRKGGSPYYHLYEIQADGTGLRQLTDGPYDDLEPSYLPDGGIVFVSSRCNRWVNCWLTRVAILHRCDTDGRNIRVLSSNNEQDNTPWVLANGQILYTRWEYVDRSQVSFHHLWIASPDGARQTVFYGNLRPSTAMIDAKPIPNSPLVVASFSPGHGKREHEGFVTVLDPRAGPDAPQAVRSVSRTPGYRDPWAFSADAFMAAHKSQIVLMDGQGRTQVIYDLPAADQRAGLQCHEPRPIAARPREAVISPQGRPERESGRILVVDAHSGRNMPGVQRGEIKKLLVLETLPKPVNFSGGMEPLSYGGTFTLERILGTIPVEPDGSAYAEVPALRSLFFVALDENDLSVKRMQSFTTVMPGETTTCIGCHELRTQAPPMQSTGVAAVRRAPSKIEPLHDIPDVLDFPRDIQPLLDAHCVRCHDCDRPEGGVNLSGDRGPMFSLSYFSITAHSLVADGRNGMGNRRPRDIGSSASRLMQLIDGSHYGAKFSENQRKMLRLWIDSGASYPGTYASLGTGMIGGILEGTIDRSDLEWPSVKMAAEVLSRRCDGCHHGSRVLPHSPSDEIGNPPWVALKPDDVRRRFARHLVYNLTRPEKSLLLLAPLTREAGGHQRCGEVVFRDRNDADYQVLLRSIRDAQAKLNQIKRFDMPGFQPRPEYLREMRRYGILSARDPADAPVDPYATDRAYWESLWYRVSSLQSD